MSVGWHLRYINYFQPNATTHAWSESVTCLLSEVFMQAFEQLADEGAQAILSIHISETLSATVNSARIAAEQFKRIPVTVLDSRCEWTRWLARLHLLVVRRLV